MVSEGPQELCEYVRRSLPLRARLVGRERLDDLTLIAITEWPCSSFAGIRRDSGEEEKILYGVTANVKRVYEAIHASEKNYGFIWAFVLSSAVSAIVQLILQWWLSRSANRLKMAAWQYGLKGGS